MTQPRDDKRELEILNLKQRLARMSADEVAQLNRQALITILFIYSNGAPMHSEQNIRDYPGLADRNPIVHETVGDYFILDLLRCNGYIEGESNRQSKWYRIILTDNGLELATRLHRSFVFFVEDHIIAPFI
jgi:hypothetical protein